MVVAHRVVAPKGKGEVVLSFADENDRQIHLAMIPEQALRLSADILQNVETTTIRPFSPREQTASYEARGFEVLSRSIGKVLVVHLAVEEGLRTMSLELSHEMTRALITDLARG